MQAYEQDVIVEEDGQISLGEIPVRVGDRVRVIVLLPDQPRQRTERYPLRGAQPYRFDNPTDPVAPEDWE